MKPVPQEVKPVPQEEAQQEGVKPVPQEEVQPAPEELPQLQQTDWESVRYNCRTDRRLSEARRVFVLQQRMTAHSTAFVPQKDGSQLWSVARMV